MAHLAGTSLTGRHLDPGAPLLHITFHRSEDPEVPVREALVIGRSFDSVSDDRLRELLSRARVFRKVEIRDRPKRGGRGRGRGRRRT